MSNLSLNIPHNLTQEEALNRIKKLITDLKEEQKGNFSDVKEEWQGNKGDFTINAKGFELSGSITANSNDVAIEADLPFAVSFFKSTIASMITERAKKLLA